MMPNLLENPSFRMPASLNRHLIRCYTPLNPQGQVFYDTEDYGNIIRPEGWNLWAVHATEARFRWDPDNQEGWSVPEIKLTEVKPDGTPQYPSRWFEDNRSLNFFNTFRTSWTGLYQRLKVPGAGEYRFHAFGHAWQANDEFSGDPTKSWVVGDQPFTMLLDEVEEVFSGQEAEALAGIRFRVGIDPSGGIDPLDENVVWAPYICNYNKFFYIPPVTSQVSAEYMTVFIESQNRWRTRMNDRYVALPTLIKVLEPEPADRHKVVVNLLPQTLPLSDGFVVMDRTFPGKETIAYSADDAAWLTSQGDPESFVRSWEPHLWGGDIKKYLLDRGAPSVVFDYIRTTPPDPHDPVNPDPPSPPPNVLRRPLKHTFGMHTIKSGGLYGGNITDGVIGRWQQFGMLPASVKGYGLSEDMYDFHELKSRWPEILVIGRLSRGVTDYNVEGPGFSDPNRSAHLCMESLIPAWEPHKGVVDYWEITNEQAPSSVENAVDHGIFYAECARLATAAGFKILAGSWSYGVPKMEDWEAMCDRTVMFEELLTGGHGLSLHEYGQFPEDEPWHILRYRMVYDQILKPRGYVVPLFITEYNVFRETLPKDDAYLRAQWLQYEAELWKDQYVHSFHYYTIEHFGIDRPYGEIFWRNADVLGEELRQVTSTREIPEPLPPLPPPSPPPSPEPPEDIVDIDMRETIPRRYDHPSWPGGRWPTRYLEQIKRITVHHIGSLADVVRHSQAYLYKDVGRPAPPYTYWIERDGTIRKLLYLTEANWHDHSIPYREHLSIGLNGALHQYLPTSAQTRSLVKLVKWVIEHPQMNVTRDTVLGHMDWFSTECPGWQVKSGSRMIDHWKAHFFQQLDAAITPPVIKGPTLLGFNDPNDQGAFEYLNGINEPSLLVLPVFLHEGVKSFPKKNPNIFQIVNLRWSWSTDKGGSGTLPRSDQETQIFIDRAVQTINSNPDIGAWSILNEQNNPREWPREGSITPARVVQVYNAIYARVNAKLSPGALDPFNAQAGDPKDWLQAIYSGISGAQFIEMHGYIHGPDPALVTSNQKFTDWPLTWQYYHYIGCVTELAKYLPVSFKNLPIYVTEFNHVHRETRNDLGWVNDERASNIVSEAYRVAVANQLGGLALYRWRGDDWEVHNNSYVLNAVRQILGG